MSGRTGQCQRMTSETDLSVVVNLDGAGIAKVWTGIGFLDHMLAALAKHSRIDIELKCVGDLHVDDHHTAEDSALGLGAAIDQALGDRDGVRRFGSAYVPLDEAMARAVVDLSGRPHASIDLGLWRAMIGMLACENVGHFFSSMATAGGMTLHVDVLKGVSYHHKAEAAFEAVARALRGAVGV